MDYQAIINLLETMRMQALALVQLADSCLVSIRPNESECSHANRKVIPGSTMGNAQWVCADCGVRVPAPAEGQ